MSHQNNSQSLYGSFVSVTTLGTYIYISGSADGDQQQLLGWLFSLEKSPQVDETLMKVISDQAGISNPRLTLQNMARRRLIEFSDTACIRSTAPLEEALPDLLERLSDGNSALLADMGGLCMASTGFAEEVTASLPALASKLIGSMEHAGEGLLDLLGIKFGLPCIFDLKQKRLLSFMPMNFGSHHFVVVIQGKAMFHGTALRDLVWILTGRYGNTPSASISLATTEDT